MQMSSQTRKKMVGDVVKAGEQKVYEKRSPIKKWVPMIVKCLRLEEGASSTSEVKCEAVLIDQGKGRRVKRVKFAHLLAASATFLAHSRIGSYALKPPEHWRILLNKQ